MPTGVAGVTVPSCHRALTGGKRQTGDVGTDAMQTFSALLALAALLGTAVTAVSLTIGRGTPWGTEVVRLAVEHSMRLVLLLTATSTLGSLWFSEVANYEPCRLCWYQRIFMYSLAVLSLVAVVRRERIAAPYVLSLSVTGAVVSAYHYLLEWFPRLESGVCSLEVPCTTVWFREFGFVTLPFMAGTAFIAVTTVVAAGRTS